MSFKPEQITVMDRCRADLAAVDVTPSRFAAHYDGTVKTAGGSGFTGRTTMTYIGILSVFLGIGTFIGMQWDSFGSFLRILMTAGLGIAMLNGTIAMQRRSQWVDFLPGAYLVSLFMITTGLFVTLHELVDGDDAVAACILVFGAMLAASVCLYAVLRQTSLVFGCLVFLNGLMIALCEKADLSWEATGLAIAMMNSVIAYGLHGKGMVRLGVLCDLLGLGGIYIVAWDLLLHRDGANLLLVALGIYGMWIGTKERNRLKLFLGVLQTFGAICYYTGEYFADTLSWPLCLIILGGIFIGLGRQTRKLLDKIS